MKKIVSLSESDVPKVSICIPVRNGAQFIEQAISSALQQSYVDYELIIVDNDSTDNTVALVRAMALCDSRIQLFINERNLGLVGNLNQCLQHARGDYVKFVMADDALTPDCLESMVQSLDTQPSVVLVAGARRNIDAFGNVLGRQCYARKRTILSGTVVIQRCLAGGNYIGEPSAVMFRRRDAERGFNQDFLQLPDMEMWFYLLEHGDFLSMPEPLSLIRRHAGQLSSTNEKSTILVEECVRLFEQYRDRHYIRWTLFHSIQHKFRMASRLWRSRQYFTDDRRYFLIKQYSSRFAYHAYAPCIALMLTLLKRLKRKAPV